MNRLYLYRPSVFAVSCFAPIVFAASLPGCSSQDSKAAVTTPTSQSAALSAKVVTARYQTWPKTTRIQGSLHGDEEAVIGAKVAGRVKDIAVDRGTAVKEGDILVQLEPEEFALKVQSAMAQVNQVRAKIGLKGEEPEDKLDRTKAPPVVQEQAMLAEERLKLERTRGLIRQSAAAIEEVQKEEAAMRVGEARVATALNTVDEQIALLGVRRVELALARQQEADATIRAPFQGIVQRRQVARGVYLHVGDPVLTLVRNDPLRFQGGVPERDASRITVGEEIRIFLEGEDKPIPVRVSRISPALDPASRALTIEADLPNPKGRLRAGVFAVADIVVDPKSQTLAIPQAAVFEFAGVEKVWLVHDGKVEERRIHTGRRGEGQIEVVDGLASGEQIIADARQGRPGPIAASE